MERLGTFNMDIIIVIIIMRSQILGTMADDTNFEGRNKFG